MSEQHRSVFALDDLAALEDAVAAARAAGVADEDIALVARHDIELELDPRASDSDAQGHVRGLLAGLSAITVPTLGVSVAGAGLISLLGSNIAGWFRALGGDHATDDVRARYRALVQDGKILLVVTTSSPARHEAAHAAIAATGAVALDDGQP